MTAAREVGRDGAEHPKRLGRYDILLEIASGGMASVYLGRATGMAGFERIVAIKCCHPHLRKDDEFVRMFLDEARLAARIHHPNVVATLDVGEADSLFLVMEYIEGDRLSSIARAAHRAGTHVPPGIALRVMIDALNGLHKAHELTDASGSPLKIVHRDVSPQNILVGIDGTSRITDFGIARAEQRATVTRQGELKGKIGYMAPEQLRSEPVDRRVDLFAAGVVLWEVLTNRRLFRGDSDIDSMQRVMHAPIPPASTFAKGIPPALDEALIKALARDKDARFADALQFIDALEACGVPVASPRVVAEYVEKTMAEVLTRRRALLRAATEQSAAPDAVQWNEDPISISVVEPVSAVRDATPAAKPEPSSGARGAVIGALVTLLVVAAIGLGWMMLASRGEPTSPRAEPSPPPASATPPPAPISVAAPAPSEAPAAPPPETSVAAPPPTPAPSEPATPARPAVRAHRATPEAPPTTTTSAPPPTEFHPEAI